jgi:hypothetical protein
MFSGALSFDQDLSSWDVSAGTDFVSDTGGGHKNLLLVVGVVLHRYVFRLLEHCHYFSRPPCCWQHGCFVAHTCNNIIVMLMRNRHNESEQSNKLTIKHILTLLFFSVSQYHHFSRHNDLEQ